MRAENMTGLSRKVSTRTHVQAAFGPSQVENDQPHQLVTPVVLKRTCFARATLHVILHERHDRNTAALVNTHAITTARFLFNLL
jgi:hypothetical protein